MKLETRNLQFSWKPNTGLRICVKKTVREGQRGGSYARA